MVSVCFYFQVHQPFRLRKYQVFEIGKNSNYFDDEKNHRIMKRVSEKCYLPANSLMLDLIEKYGGEFRISYSITGCALEQFELYYPEVLQSFQELVSTGCVEILDETYYHSLSFLYSEEEFMEQIRMHNMAVRDLLNYEPKVFRNTELTYNNDIAKKAEDVGYIGILAEGADKILDWRSPNYVYSPPENCRKIKILLKNYRLSDDIAFRFSERNWEGWPLTADKFASWINAVNGDGNVVNLFMDYETFGEHQWKDTGIFDFLNHLPGEILKYPDNDFKTPTEVIKAYPTVGSLNVNEIVSWADVERDLSAWLGNDMQKSAVFNLYELEKEIKESNDSKLIEDWRKLQLSDHLYYMCTKWFNDGDVHKYFNVYDRPHDSFIAFMNVINDMKIRLESLKQKKQKPMKKKSRLFEIINSIYKKK